MKEIKLTGKTKDGVKLEIRKDATHFHAYTEDGKEYGQPFMNLDYLLTYFGVTLDGQQDPEAVKEVAPQKPVEKKVGEAEAGDKRYEIYFNGFHYRAQAMQGPAEPIELRMDLGVLLKEIGATGAALSWPALKEKWDETDAAGGLNTTEQMEEKLLPPPANNDQLAAVPEPAATTEAAAPIDVKDASPADVTACGQHKEGECKMDGVACEGQCGEHAQRAKEQKDAAESKKDPKAPEISRKRVK